MLEPWSSWWTNMENITLSRSTPGSRLNTRSRRKSLSKQLMISCLWVDAAVVTLHEMSVARSCINEPASRVKVESMARAINIRRRQNGQKQIDIYTFRLNGERNEEIDVRGRGKKTILTCKIIEGIWFGGVRDDCNEGER